MSKAPSGTETLGAAQAPAKMFGSVELREMLGEGGMGTVYRGYHTVLDKTVALKLIRPDLVSRADIRDRFLQEARKGLLIKAEEIVSVMDCSQQDGQYFILMEFVEGGGLNKLLEGGKSLPVERACAVALDVARGLRAAHRKEIIHRDIKPENILISRDGHAKIADLGLAKSLIPDPSPRAPKGTQVGSRMGTPGYMAPEQIADTSSVDHRADMFSLGAMLYEMVKGEKAFSGETTDEIFQNTWNESPPPLSGEAATRLGPIIDKLLKKNRDERYSSYDDLIADLERCLAAPGVAPTVAASAASISPVVQTQPSLHPTFVWRGRGLLGLGLGVAVLASAIGFTALRRGVAASPKPASEATKPAAVGPVPPSAPLPTPTPIPSASEDNVAPEVKAALNLAYTKELAGGVPSAEVRLLAPSGRDHDSVWRALPNGAALTTGDRYRIEVRPGSAGHLYVFQVDSRGKLDLIFPRLPQAEFSSGENPVVAGRTITLPSGGRAFNLDNHVGVEQVYAVATPTRWPEIEAALMRAGRAAPRSRPITAPVMGRDRGIGAVVEAVPNMPANMVHRPSGDKVVAMVTGTKGVLVLERWFNHVARSQ
jgi:tRNA A-37 threonylcarbamoyl transferase component Bud32